MYCVALLENGILARKTRIFTCCVDCTEERFLFIRIIVCYLKRSNSFYPASNEIWDRKPHGDQKSLYFRSQWAWKISLRLLTLSWWRVYNFIRTIFHSVPFWPSATLQNKKPHYVLLPKVFCVWIHTQRMKETTATKGGREILSDLPEISLNYLKELLAFFINRSISKWNDFFRVCLGSQS